MEVDMITNLLTILLIIISVVLVILIFVFVMLKIKSRQTIKANSYTKNNKDINTKGKVKENQNEIAKHKSVLDFMEFEKVEDNMIIQKAGVKYLMVVECQGVNYDLMSSVEKTGVEESFIQFLNTLRHPIQIYLQTRPINLENSIKLYKSKLEEIENKYQREKQKYESIRDNPMYTKEQINKEFYELTKITNLYEYGKDVIADTQQMSLNKNILTKKYYIIIPYYPSDLGNNDFDAEEIKNIAFSELYTRSQAIIRTLSAAGVNGRILNSEDLVELLYMAYNRDEAETFGLERALRAEYDQIYATAPDVLDKKMDALNEKIEMLGIEKAQQKIAQVKSEKERALEDKESKLDQLINEIAKIVLEENKDYVGRDVAESAIQKIEEEENSKEGGNEDVQKRQTKRKTTRQSKRENA